MADKTWSFWWLCSFLGNTPGSVILFPNMLFFCLPCHYCLCVFVNPLLLFALITDFDSMESLYTIEERGMSHPCSCLTMPPSSCWRKLLRLVNPAASCPFIHLFKSSPREKKKKSYAQKALANNPKDCLERMNKNMYIVKQVLYTYIGISPMWVPISPVPQFKFSSPWLASPSMQSNYVPPSNPNIRLTLVHKQKGLEVNRNPPPEKVV